MSLFYPTITLRHISEITPALLEKLGITTLLVDVDNTLTTHNNPLPDRRALAWLDTMKRHKYPLVILSNNRTERVRRFARRLELDYTANAMKPLSKGFRETARRLKVTPEEMALVGDQIFTDVLGANLFGCKSILLQPLEMEKAWPFRLKRQLEKGILKRYRQTQKERGYK